MAGMAERMKSQDQQYSINYPAVWESDGFEGISEFDIVFF